MKPILILLVIACTISIVSADPTVNIGVDVSQPKVNTTAGSIIKYTLPPDVACTTKGWFVGNKTGHTLQYADSVPPTGLITDKTVDTVILNIRFQVANHDLNAAYNATGYDSVAHIDTLINHTVKTWGHVIDYSAKAESTGVRRHMYERWIIKNTHTDTLKGLWLFPGFLP
jgi:hypothetical protein